MRVRRIVTIALLVASVPIGVGVGFWTALLLVPVGPDIYGVAVGGGAYDCLSITSCQPAVETPFEWWQSAVFGAGAMVAVIVITLAASRLRSARMAKTAAWTVLGVAAGVATGLWTVSVTYLCAAPVICYPEPRFVTWQSCLVGGATAAIFLIMAGTLDRGFARGSVQGIRNLSRFLFADLGHRRQMVDAGETIR